MPRAIIVHGWESSPGGGWKPWLKKELEKKGFTVLVPALPDSDHPRLPAWLAHLQKTITKPDPHTYLVGHSLGCITLLRYLERIHTKIGGAVLVAGFTSTLGYQELESFFKRPINWNTIRKHCRQFTALHSDNDPFVSMHYADFFRTELKAKIIVKHNQKHFSGHDGILTVPDVLKEVLRMSR